MSLRRKIKRDRGFTLIEIAMVLVVIGILLTIGAGLVGILSKKAKFNESREIVKAAKEAVIGFATKYKRLPSTLASVGAKDTDAYGNPLMYTVATGSDTVGIDICCTNPGLLAVNDKGSPRDVVFIVFSRGSNGNNETGTGLSFNIYEQDFLVSGYNYDDIVEYVDINQLREILSCSSVEIRTTSLPEGTEDMSYNAQLQGFGGCTPYTWSPVGSIGGGLSLNASGTISGAVNISATPTGTLSACSGTIGPFNVTLTDNQGKNVTKNLSILVYPQTLRITNTDMPSTTVGTVSGSFATLNGTGGRYSYSWSLSGNPAWLTVNAVTGVLSVNNPPTAGDYPFTAILSDTCSTTSRAFSIRVNAVAGASPTCTLTANPNPITSGQTTILTWSITNGPANGSFSPTSGTCTTFTNSSSGNCVTAALSSSTTFVLTVTNANGSNNCTVTVTTTCPALTNTTPNPMLSGTVGVAYLDSITYTGGQTPVSCSISAGSLPPGLSLVGCTIQGTPTTPGTYNFTTRVTDSCSTPQTSDKATSITINAPPCPALTNTTPNPLPGGSTCTAYSQNITYSGGVAPVTCSISVGTLPPGLFLSGAGNCSISGTPTTAGNYNFTTRVTDSCAVPQISDSATSINISGCASYSLRNQSGATRYYRRNGGACTPWATTPAASISVLPADSYSIYSNNTCTTPYCANPVTYCQQKPFDTDGDCLTRMTTGCNFADR